MCVYWLKTKWIWKKILLSRSCFIKEGQTVLLNPRDLNLVTKHIIVQNILSSWLGVGSSETTPARCRISFVHAILITLLKCLFNKIKQRVKLNGLWCTKFRLLSTSWNFTRVNMLSRNLLKSLFYWTKIE